MESLSFGDQLSDLWALLRHLSSTSRPRQLTLFLWDDERGISVFREYYALRDEVQGPVTESKCTWMNTPFPLFTVQ